MIDRKISGFVLKEAASYPVITILGPRQAGKTTLAKTCFPGHRYVNLEDPPTRALAVSDERKFFALYPPPLLIDEIQRVPQLASSIQVRVDSDRDRMGEFVLTGSQQPRLAAAVSQSLAGRTSVLSLMPLTVGELRDAGIRPTTDEMLLRGFMPDVHVRKIPPSSYYRNYFQTYVERDVRQLINLKSLTLFERFMTLLAGRVGQVVNASSLAGETGVSATTVGEWLSILEASFLVFRLPPHFSNVSKRMVKSPKVYFTDVGLAAWLLGLETPEQVSRDPLRGQLFENMVVSDVRKQTFNAGGSPRLSFLRTEKGFEVDLIVSRGTTIQPVEIKSAMTYHESFAANLRRLAKAEGSVIRPCVVYDGEMAIPSAGEGDVAACNFRDFAPFERSGGG